ncbi:MAG: NAD-dependent epimerase/dehydratase family protein [Bacteroidota bacterium]
MKKETILLTGGGGQIGTALSAALRKIYGEDQVIASDIKTPDEVEGRFIMLDILNTQRMAEVIADYGITQIYHLAAILSATGEWMPMKTWNVNFNALLQLFELAKEKGIRKFFFPSTIAVFGASTPRKRTPQHTSLEPSTIYGISKLTGELWSQYYFKKYGLDIRSVRYPGIISHETMPGGGTTDYAVEIFYKALEYQYYECFLRADTYLPMIYMPDAIKGTLQLMEAPSNDLSIRTAYNLSGISFSPAELAAAIQQVIPDFTIAYQPDFRQAIADSWPSDIDDSMARKDWNWNPTYDLEAITKDMIRNLLIKLDRFIGSPTITTGQ